jgi:hypothetical protein
MATQKLPHVVPFPQSAPAAEPFTAGIIFGAFCLEQRRDKPSTVPEARDLGDLARALLKRRRS